MGFCRLNVNGTDCQRPAFQRGMCVKHWAYCQKHKLLDIHGAPKRGGRRSYSVNPLAEEGICRMVVDGVPCTRKVRSRGFCKWHYEGFWRKHFLDKKAFFLPLKSVTNRDNAARWFRVKRRPIKGVCRLIFRDQECSRPAVWRGLCYRHWDHLKRMGLLEVFAAPKTTPVRYEVKLQPAEGTCRITADGVPCKARAERRGLCIHHYASIWARRDLDIEALAAPKYRPIIARMKKKYHPPPGICIIMVDGEDCLNAAFRRGLCRQHFRAAYTSPQGIDYWALPKDPPVWHKVKEHSDGLCRIIEIRGSNHEEHPCTDKAFMRGICNHHYRRFLKRQNLAMFALPDARLQHSVRQSRDNPTTHMAPE
ncbi:MAG TPA: hypothetical protein PKY77_20840 [Phycisphaerae bacterium]|nr:hypothetical protein [Phycisphaerae bacterium]